MLSAGKGARRTRVGVAGRKARAEGRGLSTLLPPAGGSKGREAAVRMRGWPRPFLPAPAWPLPPQLPVPCRIPAGIPTWARRDHCSSPGTVRGPGVSATTGSSFPAPPCCGRAGREWWSLRRRAGGGRRGRGRRRGRSGGSPQPLAPPALCWPRLRPPHCPPTSRSCLPVPPHWDTQPAFPSAPTPAYCGVDACLIYNLILRTFIECPPSARHCARDWGFKDPGFEGLPGWGGGPIRHEGNSL